jgi:hypothetical protein
MIVALLAVGVMLSARGGDLTAPALCKSIGIQTSNADPALLLRPQDRAAVRKSKLGDLPKANLEIAVERKVDGCPAPVVVSYRVERDGRFASGR